MNRVILLLNVVVLVVTFVLALSATDSQIGILRSASAAYGLRTRPAAFPDASLAYLRVVHSLESLVPKDDLETLTSEGLRAIHQAVRRYYQVISAGVEGSLYAEADGKDLRRSYEVLGREARLEVESIVGPVFKNPNVVRRLTTAIIGNCR